MKKNRLLALFLAAAIAAMLALSGCTPEVEPEGAAPGPNGPIDVEYGEPPDGEPLDPGFTVEAIGISDGVPDEPDVALFDGTLIPAWNGTDAYVEVNGNEPWFSDADKARTDPFEDYSDLDQYGRCGIAYANICKDLMPTEKRGEIGSVKPSGWHTVRYNGVVNGNYLYNRCHLIGYQLAGENANKKNLITGTRYLNIDGMLGFENLVDGYVDDTGNHVLYRVTPVYDGDDLVARGVLMEGWSVEDGGAGVRFNIFAYNNQPGVVIDYHTGESRLADGRDVVDGVPVDRPEADPVPAGPDEFGDEGNSYIVNTKSGKFHLEGCGFVEGMNESNRAVMDGTADDMISAGYSPCGSCHPEVA